MTYKDLQEHTGLSLSTISKYFNGLPLRESNRLAVEAAATELGYRVNTLARNLRTQRSRTVGVLLPVLDNNFHLSIIAGIEASLSGSGVGVVVSASRDGNGRLGAAVDALADRMVDGIIAVPAHQDAEALTQVWGRGLPVVLIDRLVDGLDCDAVVLDNGDAARQAVRHLVDHGHRRVAAVAGPPDIWSLQGRNEGFFDALRQHGLEAGPATVRSGPLTVESGVASMRSLLAEPERPTAVVCMNYELTIGALIAVNESGLRIPEDISFVGFDSLELSQVMKPRLSMVVQPTHEIAVRAADLMRQRLEPRPDDAPEPEPYRRVVLPAELVPGGSVARPRS
ncbi:LacI family DNA-binding transcriptional regulator [Microlunatus spumicola]|uniref:LacI family DNA-binding transcriptional regulator n=1 Tax=Microlunatus spumicola TaxID=81499 RepID=A0ABP6WYV1_9ACTN